MNTKIFNLFVEVIQAVDVSDNNPPRVSQAMLNLHDALVKEGYDSNMTWRQALTNTLKN